MYKIRNDFVRWLKLVLIDKVHFDQLINLKKKEVVVNFLNNTKKWKSKLVVQQVCFEFRTILKLLVELLKKSNHIAFFSKIKMI